MEMNFEDVMDMGKDDSYILPFTDRNGFKRVCDMYTFTQFIRAYERWIRDGAPVDSVFDREEGLCHNFGNYTFGQKVGAERIYGGTTHEATRNLYSKAAQLCSHIIADTMPGTMSITFPFDATEHDFLNRRNAGTQHECPVRNRWVDGFLAATSSIL